MPLGSDCLAATNVPCGYEYLDAVHRMITFE